MNQLSAKSTRPVTRIRNPDHAGSWYTDDAAELDSLLTGWLRQVHPEDQAFPIKGSKAIIAPHAGYSYSGPNAAWAYKSIDTTGIKRVFILGPSHHVYLRGCALSECSHYAVPGGVMALDLDTIKELRDTGRFSTFDPKSDEMEHSIEMHLPYIYKVFEGKEFEIVPIFVGSMSKEEEASYGALLAPFLAREDTFCVVSSDFCHWGSRFSYTFYYPEPSPSAAPGYLLSRAATPKPLFDIYKSIDRLDHEAIDILTVPPSSALESHARFAEYLTRTKNTICGRHPIGVLFGALSFLEKEREVRSEVRWVKYDQSSQCKTVKDSSVSYASAYIRFQV